MANDYRPDVFTINNVLYYFADDIKAYFPEVYNFTGSKGLYGIINNGKIKRTEYIHAYFINETWIVMKDIQHFTEVLVTKAWIDKIFKKNKINDCKYTGYVEPDAIILNKSEKIADVDGRIFEIRLYGDRNTKGIFFNLYDVVNCNDDMIEYYSSITYNKTEKRTRLFYRRIKLNEPLKLSYYFTYYGISAFLTKGLTFPFLERLNDWINNILNKKKSIIFPVKQPCVSNVDDEKNNDSKLITKIQGNDTIEIYERTVIEQKQYYETIINEMKLKNKNFEIDILKLRLKNVSR